MTTLCRECGSHEWPESEFVRVPETGVTYLVIFCPECHNTVEANALDAEAA